MKSSPNRGCLAMIIQLLTGQPRSNTYRVENRDELIAHSVIEREESLPYRAKDHLLTPAEISFFHVLESIVQAEAVICPKVRMLDILYVTQKQQNFAYFGKIAQKHVDFLLCAPKSMKPILAIELDDSSHQRADRIERDEFVDAAFKTAGLPLIHIPVRRTYNTSEVAALVSPHLQQKITASTSVSSDAPICPNCQEPMVMRTAKRGNNAGERFWGCRNYPDCRQMYALKSS